MLVNLDNEVYFKSVFTDVEVFTAFVKDVIGIDINITKVETEKVLLDPVSAIKFKMDLFAEDIDQRTVVEIQKVDYDYTYDRFSHYFLGNLIDVQRSSKRYAFAKDVYVIIVVTAAYKISDKNNEPIKEDVMVTDINPRTLKDEMIYMHDHKMVILNTVYVNKNTPQEIKDWLDLISESMKNPENPKINTSKEAIARAAKLAELNSISPEQLAAAKIQEMKKATVALVEDTARKEGLEIGLAKGEEIGLVKGEEIRVKARDKSIQKSIKRGKLSHQEIAEDFEVSVEYVKKLAQDMNK